MEKLPSWLATVNAQFICNNCPNRQTKNIAFVNLEPAAPAAKLDDGPDVEEVADEAETAAA